MYPILSALGLALSLVIFFAQTARAAEQPPTVVELLSSARLWEVKSRADLARQALEKLLLAYPDQPDALLQLGMLEIRSAHADVAAKLLARAEAAHPGQLQTLQFEDVYRIATRDHLHMATIRRLQQSGKPEEAVKELRALFPNGAPVGQLGLDYYRIIASNRGGWDEARNGFTRLMRENPEDPQYAIALADHLLDRPATRTAGIAMLARLADNEDADHQRVMDLWQGALARRSGSGASTAALHNDLGRVPNNQQVQRRIIAHARAEQARALIANDTLSRDWAGQQQDQLQRIERLLVDASDRRPQDADVLESLGLLRLRQNRYDDAWDLFRGGRAHSAPSTRDKWGRLMAAAMFAKWTAESDMAREQGELEFAARRLRCALAIDSGSYYSLGLIANRLARENERSEAEDIYRRVLALDAVNDTSLSGFVALLSQTGRSPEALMLLRDLRDAHPAETKRLDAARAGILRDQADTDIAAGRLGAGLRTLETAQTLAPEDPWIRYDLAKLYVRLGVPRQARELMAEGARNAQPGDTDIHYAQALLLTSLDDDAAGLDALSKIVPAQRSAGINSLQQRLQAMAWRRAQAAQFAAADRAQAAGHLDVALTIYEGLVAQRPDDIDLRLSYARLLRRAGDRPAAASELNHVLAQAADSDARIAIAKERMYLGDLSGSRELVDAVLMSEPENTDALVQAGRIEEQQRHYESAMAYFKQAQDAERKASLLQGLPDPGAAQKTSAADEEIASLDERRKGGFVTAGPAFRNKPGDAGISAFSEFELPVEYHHPLGYDDQLFVHVDPVRVSAGTLAADYNTAALFGKVQAFGPASAASFSGGTGQPQSGADAGIGYQNENWRFDIGTTPIGFFVQDVVGGVRRDGKLGDVDYTIDVSRRPVTSSLLSYAGARDPVTGEIWGGVRSNGAELRLARYEHDWDASATAGLHRLTGREVPGNNYLDARVGGDWNFINRDDLQLSLGLSATHWRYGQDLSQYTFGQGGYYSPQFYTSFGVPAEWTGRIGRWSYQLKGSVSYSWSRSSDSPFYPGDPALQAMAAGSPLPSGYSSPVYGGGSSSGIGYTFKSALEYQINQDYFIGGQIALDRSAYYAPNFFALYLRRMFDPWNKPVPYPPRPPKPYSDY
jgi:tetratricopeptide (TPR) repeat protein